MLFSYFIFLSSSSLIIRKYIFQIALRKRSIVLRRTIVTEVLTLSICVKTVDLLASGKYKEDRRTSGALFPSSPLPLIACVSPSYQSLKAPSPGR